MYYLTVVKDGVDLISQRPYEDYAAAIAGTAEFYRPKAGRSVLKFTTEVINGAFARSFATLTRPEDIPADHPFPNEIRQKAAKQSNAFSFDATYLFLIENDLGVSERIDDADDE
jgi:hypothetical protein